MALRQDERGLVRAAELALAGDESAELLLVLDQFEELFTLVDDEERRVRFLALLAATAGSESRVRVVLTLRADFYDRPLRYPGFSELVERGTIAVHPLTGDELRRAVVEPAHRAGLSVEDGLVAEMVADVQGEPGALPLLQYALSELYERRDERTLTLESYQEIGGISGALARRADELFLSLAEDAQATVRRLFTRLVALGEGAEDTRRRVLRSEVDAISGGQKTIGEVIDAYGRHRLLAFDRDPISGGPTVEIAHEVLLREWPRLRGWIDQDRDGLRLLRHLSESAAAWDRLGRDEGDLYRGARLEQSLAWTEAHPSDLNPLETEFLVASRERRDADRRAEQERIEQRIRQNRRLRVALAVIAVALLGAIVAGVLAFDQRGEANQQAERAEAEAARANQESARAASEAERATEQAAVAQEQAELAAAEAERADQTAFESDTGRLIAESAARVVDNRRLSLLLAAEGHRRAGSIETLGGLQRALTGSLGFLGYFGEGPTYRAVALGPDDRLVAATALAAEVYDLETGELEQRTPLPEGATVVALAPRGQLVAVAREDDTAAVLDTGTGGELDAPLEMALSRDLGHLATTQADGTVLLWDLATGRERTIVTDLAVVDQARTVPVAFSPDGSLLATGSGIPPDANAPPVVGVRVWDVPSGAQLGGGFEPNPSFEDEPERGVDRGFGTQALAFDADGRTLTTVGRWTVRRWSLETGEMLSDFLVPGARDYSTQTPFGYAQLSDTVGAGLLPGGSVSVFDLQSGELLEGLIDMQLTAGGLAASADGSAVAVAGEDGIGL